MATREREREKEREREIGPPAVSELVRRTALVNSRSC